MFSKGFQSIIICFDSDSYECRNSVNLSHQDKGRNFYETKSDQCTISVGNGSHDAGGMRRRRGLGSGERRQCFSGYGGGIGPDCGGKDQGLCADRRKSGRHGQGYGEGQ